MRAWLPALALAITPVVIACSIEVRQRDGRGAALGDIAIYPRAHRLAPGNPDSPRVSFSGSFADTRVVAQRFASDDAPAMVLEFYRAAMRSDTEVIECRGDIRIRRSSRAEKPVCLERSASPVVQLVAGTRPYYRLVAVDPRGIAAEFTVASIYTE